ncbi:MAG: ABC transporter permease [Acidimicrobiales bacterium]
MAVKRRSAARSFLAAFAENRLGLVGVAVIVAMALFSFVGPVFYHANISHTVLGQATMHPGGAHPLGTDGDGYDVLGRLMAGGQSSLEVGFAAALLGGLLGTLWGSVAGYFGGWVDGLMMRLVDSMLAIPSLLLLLVLASMFVPNVPMLIVVVALVSWLPAARLVRGETLSLRERDFVRASRVMGTRSPKILVRHVIPNVAGIIAVQTTFQVADAILLVAALSFLGLGPPPPEANWGGMLSNGLNYVFDGYWWLIYPAGAAIVITVIAFNLVGDALRDALEVRLRHGS